MKKRDPLMESLVLIAKSKSAALLFLAFLFSPHLFSQACDTMEADFASSAPACTGEGVDFVNTGSSNSAYDYSWDFGAGATPSTSTAENPSGVVYSSAGTKTVTFTIVDSSEGCVVSETKGITIHETPTTGFTSTAPECREEEVDFSNTGSSGPQWNYSWDFGGGASPSTSTAEDPSGIVYSTSGTKTVTQTITDDNGNCSSTETQTISIEASPDASIATTAPGCTGEDVDFSNTGSSGGIYAYEWDLGTDANPATSPAENPTGVTYSSAGNKTARLVITNTSTGCTDTAWKSFTIHQTPNPGFASTAPECRGEPVDFSNTGSSGSQWNYNWDFGSGASPNTSTAENPKGILYSTSGTKTVTQTIYSDYCSSTFTATISIDARPDAAIAHDGPSCTGDTVQFDNIGSSSGNYDHQWDLGADADPATSTQENPEVTYSSSGNKQVRLVTENTTTGCTDTTWSTISIHQTPSPGFSSTAPVCEEAPVDFTNTGSSGPKWNYSWDFSKDASPNTSLAENPSGVSYSSSGSKTVTQTITDDNGFCSASDTQSIGILDRPDAGFSSTAPECTGEPVDFSNTGSGQPFHSHEWDFGVDASPATSTQENPTGVTYSSSGNKQVMQVIENTTTGCTDTAWKSLNIYLSPTVSFSSTAPQCAGEEVDFTNTGSSGQQWSYDWDLGTAASPNTSTSENPSGVSYKNGGSHKVTLTVSSAHCQRSDSMSISIDSLPRADAGPDTTVCADRCAQIGTPSPGSHVHDWFPTSTLDDPSIAQPEACPDASVTNYLLTQTDTVTGCTAEDSVELSMVTPAFAEAGSDVEICYGDTVQVGSGHIEGQAYRWSPKDSLTNDTISNPYAYPDTTTVYTMKTSYEGCDTITDDVRVTVHPLPDVQLHDELGRSDSSQITEGSSVGLVASGAILYEWSPEWGLSDPGVHDPTVSPEEDTTYTVIGTDLQGCVEKDSIHVKVIIPEVWAPSAFTPNGDGRNDRFYIRTKGTERFELTVFDRSGRMVFRTKDPEEGWDGNVQGSGEKLPQGAYIYRANGELSDGKTFNEKGTINLLR